ncbi:MAG: hypothetical protein VR67_06750 [Peptococcaceae bacterium BRH_c8a]|nr:MAG: hypothetical protein VR67_06750 [Peptococcaceae bacterium BRH_c8a]
MLTETEIISGLKTGKDEAVEAVLNIFGDRLLRAALAITGDLQTAEEVVQDTLLQVCRKIHSFQEQSALQTWIFRIAVNLAKNKVRGSWFRRVIPTKEKELNQLPDNRNSSPEVETVDRESREEVLRCLQSLPVKYREVLVLYYLEDLNIREICAVLEQPEGTVKSKLSRGRALIKTKMETKWGVAGGTS